MFPEPRPTVMLMLGWWATHSLPSRQGHVAALPREPWAWVLTASLKKLRAGVFSSYHCSTCEGYQDGHTSTYWSLIKRKLKATDHHFEDNCPPHKSSVPLSTQIQHRLICLSWRFKHCFRQKPEPAFWLSHCNGVWGGEQELHEKERCGWKTLYREKQPQSQGWLQGAHTEGLKKLRGIYT